MEFRGSSPWVGLLTVIPEERAVLRPPDDHVVENPWEIEARPPRQGGSNSNTGTVRMQRPLALLALDNGEEGLEEAPEAEVAGGVNEVNWVIVDIAVPVETLGVGGLGNKALSDRKGRSCGGQTVHQKLRQEARSQVDAITAAPNRFASNLG